MTLPTLIVSSGVRNILWWRVKALKGVSMLNGGRTIVALNRCVTLHTGGLTSSVNSNGLGVPTMSNLYTSASTLQARSVTASTSYLLLLFFRAALSLDQ